MAGDAVFPSREGLWDMWGIRPNSRGQYCTGPRMRLRRSVSLGYSLKAA
jgi:hypothetical protein